MDWEKPIRPHTIRVDLFLSRGVLLPLNPENDVLSVSLYFTGNLEHFDCRVRNWSFQRFSRYIYRVYLCWPMTKPSTKWQKIVSRGGGNRQGSRRVIFCLSLNFWTKLSHLTVLLMSLVTWCPACLRLRPKLWTKWYRSDFTSPKLKCPLIRVLLEFSFHLCCGR